MDVCGNAKGGQRVGTKHRTPYSSSVSVSQQTKNTEAKRQKGNYNKQEEEECSSGTAVLTTFQELI